MSAGGSALSTFGNGAAKTAAGLEKIQNGISSVIESVKTVPNDVSAALDAVTKTIDATIADVNATLRGAQSSVSKAAGLIATRSLSNVNSKRGAFQLAGESLVDGFIVGINLKSIAAAAAAAKMASGALDAAKKELDINSPSGEFMDVGMYVNYGFAKGLKKYADVAVKAAQGVGQQVLSPVIAMSDNMVMGTRLIGRGIQKAADSASSFAPTISSEKTVVMKHEFDTLHVEGVNDEGEFVAAADYSVEETLAALMRRQNRV